MTADRKAEHIDICLTKDVNADHNYWDDVHLIHRALPELRLDDIDSSITLFDKKLKAPIIIAAMTGGFKNDDYDAEEINNNLAEAAAATGVGMGVGSMRVALEFKEFQRTFEVVKDHDVPLVIGNIGAPQLIEQPGGKPPLGKDDLAAAMELVGADIMAVHLNFLQEVAMIDGDLNSIGCLEAVSKLSRDIPMLAKETGAGISRETASDIKKSGFIGIDVGGHGGTSFSAVEKHRAELHEDRIHTRIGSTFWNWGIPTPVSLLEADVGLPLIATGGIRTGVDIARALVLGATSAGIAKELLAAAVESSDAVTELLETIILELKSAMFLMGAGSIPEMTELEYVLTGTTYQWYQQCFANIEEEL